MADGIGVMAVEVFVSTRASVDATSVPCCVSVWSVQCGVCSAACAVCRVRNVQSGVCSVKCLRGWVVDVDGRGGASMAKHSKHMTQSVNLPLVSLQETPV